MTFVLSHGKFHGPTISALAPCKNELMTQKITLANNNNNPVVGLFLQQGC